MYVTYILHRAYIIDISIEGKRVENTATFKSR